MCTLLRHNPTTILCHRAGKEHLCDPPRVLPLASEAIEDQEAPDDPSAATLPETAAATAAAEAYNAGAAARQTTLQQLQALQGRLAQVMGSLKIGGGTSFVSYQPF